MAARAYAPTDKTVALEEFKKDRRFVGDWLIGATDCASHRRLADPQSTCSVPKPRRY